MDSCILLPPLASLKASVSCLFVLCWGVKVATGNFVLESYSFTSGLDFLRPNPYNTPLTALNPLV
jgi:hypothetical protein